MYAVFATVGISDPDAAHKTLNEVVVPRVRAQAGFVSGVWLEPQAGEAHSIVVFKSEETARSMAGMIEMPPGSPVEIRSVKIWEVAARA